MPANLLQSRTLAATPNTDLGTPVSAPDIAEVYATHFKYVWRCLRSLGLRDDVLDDAVQDVFLVVQRKLEQFDGQAQVSTWLYAIALRVARRYRTRAAKDARRLITREAGDEDATPADPESSVPARAEKVDHTDRLDLARRALDGLDDDKREVFVLAHIEQMSAPDIARLLGLPLNTVYSRIRAARLAFGAQITRLESPSERKSP